MGWVFFLIVIFHNIFVKNFGLLLFQESSESGFALLPVQ